MPLDKAKARSRVDGARNAYRIGIRSDYIQLLANDLEEALNLIDGSTLEVSRAKNEATRLQRELDEEKDHYRKLREKSAHGEALVTFAREVAASPKGAQKKAAALLVSMGEVPVAESATPAAVPPEEV